MSKEKYITKINPKEDERWDTFVQEHPFGSLYHHSLWADVIEKTYGYTPLYIALEDEHKNIKAALPFFIVNSQITGCRIVSLPFSDYCDALVSGTKDLKTLTNFALKELQKHGGGYLEMRTHRSVNYFSGLQFSISLDSVDHVLNLTDDLNALMNSFHKSYVQRYIKKALASSIRIDGVDNEDGVQICYDLLAKTRKKHGLPPHPYVFFKNIWEVLHPANHADILIAYEGDTPIASIILGKFRDTVYYLYGGSDSNYLSNRPNHLLLWNAIENAALQGYRYFDFGRTSITNHGLLNFKRRWGTSEYPIPHFWYSRTGESIKLVNRGSRKSTSYKHKVIQMLPLSLLKISGSLIYRHLG